MYFERPRIYLDTNGEKVAMRMLGLKLRELPLWRPHPSQQNTRLLVRTPGSSLTGPAKSTQKRMTAMQRKRDMLK
jgi:hypothetical protein